MELYVRSQKIDMVTSTAPTWGTCATSHSGEECRSKGMVEHFSQEDREAVDLLKKKGLSFSLIDLSKCSLKTKLKATIDGKARTPALILDNGTKLKGIEQIRKHLAQM